MENNILQKIKEKIIWWQTFQPILFLWENRELLNVEIDNLIQELFQSFEVDKNCLYRLSDDWEKIKIVQIRDFFSKWNIKSSFKFQIFFIENISRLTLESANASLKILEEPWIWNIIFLTNCTESWVIETILSRVQVINLKSDLVVKENDFFYNLIENFINKKDINLIKYFFNDKKIEKNDYIDFLETFLFYIKKNLVYIELLDQIEESLNLIQKNNVLPKYEIDKLLLKI